MAAKELARVRKLFVEKVHGDMIKQLLDDLFEDGVLNAGEKDSILEENPSRADRARALIDTVIRKEDEASLKMIIHLKERDPSLYSVLDQSLLQPPPYAQATMETQ